MEDPEQQISGVIRSLTQGTREEQEKALNDYFLPDAYFVHPFCRVPSFGSREIRVPFSNARHTINSRRLVQFIYQWYKIMSPRILLEVDSTSFDKKTNSLYATIRQTFTIWIVPFSLWQANVKLVCLLKVKPLPIDENKQPLPPQAEPGPHNGKDDPAPSPEKRYFIQGQQDHYQTNDMLNFIAPFGASALYYIWQLSATFLCIVGVALLWPVTSVYERRNRKKNARYREALQSWMENVESNSGSSSSSAPDGDADLKNTLDPTIRDQQGINRAARKVRASRAPTTHDAPIRRAAMDTVAEDGCIYF